MRTCSAIESTQARQCRCHRNVTSTRSSAATNASCCSTRDVPAPRPSHEGRTQVLAPCQPAGGTSDPPCPDGADLIGSSRSARADRRSDPFSAGRSAVRRAMLPRVGPFSGPARHRAPTGMRAAAQTARERRLHPPCGMSTSPRSQRDRQRPRIGAPAARRDEARTAPRWRRERQRNPPTIYVREIERLLHDGLARPRARVGDHLGEPRSDRLGGAEARNVEHEDLARAREPGSGMAPDRSGRGEAVDEDERLAPARDVDGEVHRDRIMPVAPAVRASRSRYPHNFLDR